MALDETTEEGRLFQIGIVQGGGGGSGHHYKQDAQPHFHVDPPWLSGKASVSWAAYRFGTGSHLSQNQRYFWLDDALICPYVCGLAVAGQIRWFHGHIPGYRDMSWLYSTSGSPRHC